MPSPEKKQGSIAHYFKPKPSTEVPQKRPSPGADPSATTSLKGHLLKTPGTAKRFRDATSTPSSQTPLWSPISGTSLPIRSPRAKPTDSPLGTTKRPLFNLSNKPSRLKSSSPNEKSSFAFSDVSNTSNKVIKDGVVVAVRDSDDSDSDSDEEEDEEDDDEDDEDEDRDVKGKKRTHRRPRHWTLTRSKRLRG